MPTKAPTLVVAGRLPFASVAFRHPPAESSRQARRLSMGHSPGDRRGCFQQLPEGETIVSVRVTVRLQEDRSCWQLLLVDGPRVL
eukprot:9864799-Heterocapsa_arctica.AAC.1